MGVKVPWKNETAMFYYSMLPLLARYETPPTHTISHGNPRANDFSPSTRTIHTTSSLKLFNCGMEMCCAAASYRQRGGRSVVLISKEKKVVSPECRVDVGSFLYLFLSLSFRWLSPVPFLTGAIVFLGRSDRFLGVPAIGAVHP